MKYSNMYIETNMSSTQAPMLMRENAFNPQEETHKEYCEKLQKRQKLLRDARISLVNKQKIIKNANISMDELDSL